MVDSWLKARNGYSYPVRLNQYERSTEYTNHFKKNIGGDRASTVSFENYFRKNCVKVVEVYFEVIFWKLYSQPAYRQQGTSRIIDYITERGVPAESLAQSLHTFIEQPNRRNLTKIRKLLGISTNVLAIPLTLVSFYQPENYPMIDNVTAKWVNMYMKRHNECTQAKLTRFSRNYTSLRYNDFENYLNWVNWCNEIAEKLSSQTDLKWRPRDVEMAVFTDYRCNKSESRLVALK